jgi:hypothetical protein
MTVPCTPPSGRRGCRCQRLVDVFPPPLPRDRFPIPGKTPVGLVFRRRRRPGRRVHPLLHGETLRLLHASAIKRSTFLSCSLPEYCRCIRACASLIIRSTKSPLPSIAHLPAPVFPGGAAMPPTDRSNPTPTSSGRLPSSRPSATNLRYAGGTSPSCLPNCESTLSRSCHSFFIVPRITRMSISPTL